MNPHEEAALLEAGLAAPANLVDQSPDPTMMVLPDERLWAREIKEAVINNPRLDPLTDFEYVEYALATDGNTEEALFRIEGMQTYKREYAIEDTPDQGVEHLEKNMMSLVPGFLLHLDYCAESNEGILVWDAGRFKPNNVLAQSPEHGPDYYFRTYTVSAYYMYTTAQPNFASIREGLTLILDCGEVEWENVSMEFEGRMHHELRAFYPLKWKKILAYNTGSVSNVGWSLFKQFMSPKMRNCLQLGCQIVGPDPSASSPSRLHELFVQPSWETFQINILRRARDLLEFRQANKQNFKL